MATNYKQTDNRWATYPYAGETMAAAGCGPTAVADVLDKSPVEIAKWMTNNGYASNGYGTYQNGITSCVKAYGYNCSQLTGSSYAGIMDAGVFERFKESIKNGNCGILLMGGLKTGCRNSYWSQSGHFISVVGFDNNKYLVYDPAWDQRDGLHAWSDFAGNIKHVYVTNIKWKKNSEKTDVTANSDYLFTVEQIKKGINGNSTLLAQTLLKGRGLYSGPLDGQFGDNTHKAVTEFQKAVGITVDGVVGPTCWNWLIPAKSSILSGNKRLFILKEVKYGSNAAECYFLQNMLKGLGLYSGQLDYSFGDGCKKAVITYQKKMGMSGDGIVGKNTYKHLTNL